MLFLNPLMKYGLILALFSNPGHATTQPLSRDVVSAPEVYEREDLYEIDLNGDKLSDRLFIEVDENAENVKIRLSSRIQRNNGIYGPRTVVGRYVFPPVSVRIGRYCDQNGEVGIIDNIMDLSFTPLGIKYSKLFPGRVDENGNWYLGKPVDVQIVE